MKRQFYQLDDDATANLPELKESLSELNESELELGAAISDEEFNQRYRPNHKAKMRLCK